METETVLVKNRKESVWGSRSELSIAQNQKPWAGVHTRHYGRHKKGKATMPGIVAITSSKDDSDVHGERVKGGGGKLP